MKKGSIIFCFVILFMGFVTSHTSITATIIEDKTFIEIKTEDDSVIYLPEEYYNLESNQDHVIEENIIFTNKATIKFTTNELIKEVDKEYLFVLPKLSGSYSDVKIYLPENHILSNSLVYPKNYRLSTNGKNIILEWENNSEEIIIFYKKFFGLTVVKLTGHDVPSE